MWDILILQIYSLRTWNSHLTECPIFCPSFQILVPSSQSSKRRVFELSLSGLDGGTQFFSDEAAEKDWFSGAFIEIAPDGQTQPPSCLSGCGVGFPWMCPTWMNKPVSPLPGPRPYTPVTQPRDRLRAQNLDTERFFFLEPCNTSQTAIYKIG